MPNKDGKGPEGKGPKTGRQLGNCKDAKPQEYPKQQSLGRGLGMARGRGRGCGRPRRCKED